MATSGASAPKATIKCNTCGVEIQSIAAGGGRPDIWVETSTQRKHACPNRSSSTTSTPATTAPPSNETAIEKARRELKELEEAEAKRIADEIAAAKAAEEAEKARLEAEAKAAAEAATKRIYRPKAGQGKIPQPDSGYLIDAANKAALLRTLELASEGTPQNMAFKGPPGSGKSTLAFQIGALYNKLREDAGRTFICESAGKQTSDEWYAEAVGLKDGTIDYRASNFVTGIETPYSVTVLNDLNLLQSIKVQNGLNELLDPSTRSTWVEPLGRDVTVAEGVVIIGTWNEGTVSSSELSEQIIDRFRAGCMFELPYPNAETLTAIIQERTGLSKAKAEELALLSSWLQSEGLQISPRGLVAAAFQVLKGARLGEACSFTVLGELEATDRGKAFGIIDAKCAGNQKRMAEWKIATRNQTVEPLF